MSFKTSSILTAFILAGISFCAYSDETFDIPGALKASDVLPADLIKNEYFEVREDVIWFDGLNQFTVDTEYGAIEIWGEPMLRVRLKELIAWHELNETSAIEAGAEGVSRNALRSVTALLTAFSHPITTIEGIPQGISRLFRQIGRNLETIGEVITGKKHGVSPGSLNRRGDDKASVTTEAAETLVGVNKAYRNWAQYVGVNPYTSNPVIKDELNRVAKIDAYLGTGTRLLVPDLVKGNLGIVAKVSRRIYEEDWHEVARSDKKALQKMGVDDVMIDGFLNHDFINLSLSTLIVETLNDLEGVDDRSIVIDQAMLLETESEAIWFAESVLMTGWFHTNQAPIAKMLFDTLVPVALTVDGRVIVFSAADLALWTEDVATLANEFTALYSKYSDKGEIWIADQVSPRFVKGVSDLGWSVSSGNRSTVLPEIPWGLQDDGK